MKTMSDIKGACVIDEISGCWLFAGALSKEGQARIWAWDYNKGRMAALPGKRAVWYVRNGRAVPDGHRVYGTCEHQHCLNPAHIHCGTTAEWGQHMSRTGIHKNNAARSVASRRTGITRSVLTPESYQQALTSDLTGRELARRLGVSEQTISKARTGKLVCFVPMGGVFGWMNTEAKGPRSGPA